jgi:mannose-6-phosphate isomerase-like protein (cupin superfamily)
MGKIAFEFPIHPKPTGCGPVYELKNPIERPNESFAIADMREIQVAEPHYHPETEIYFVLEGRGRMFIRDEEQLLELGSVVVIPPNSAHFTIPGGGLVLAVVNTPPFQPEHYIPLGTSNNDVGFDKAMFDNLVKEV